MDLPEDDYIIVLVLKISYPSSVVVLRFLDTELLLERYCDDVDCGCLVLEQHCAGSVLKLLWLVAPPAVALKAGDFVRKVTSYLFFMFLT